LYVKECLDTGWVSSVGSYVNKFESGMAAQVGTRSAVATASGTAALHAALLVAGVSPGDEVIVPSLTFIAPANAVRYVGAYPLFLDAESQHWQLDVEKVREFLTTQCIRVAGGVKNKTTHRTVRAVLPVHVLGHPVDMDALLEVARDFGLIVIEDATESLGSKYRGKPTGSIGLLGCFSFNGNKIITTGGGGMITTNDPKLADRARYLTTQAKDNPIEFIHGAVGYNYRLTNIQAAMGCAQLEQLDGFVRKKRQIAARYNDTLGAMPGFQIPVEAGWAQSNHWLYTVRIDERMAGISSRNLLAALGGSKIQARPFWQPMHLSPAHRDCQSWNCDVSERLWRECLSLPCSIHLSDDDQQRVISAIRSAVPSLAAGRK
jgi:perosamine synthetase